MAKRRRDKMDVTANLIGFGLLFFAILSFAYRPVANWLVSSAFGGASLAEPALLPEWVLGVYNGLWAPVTLLPPYALLWGAGGPQGLHLQLGKPKVPLWVLVPLFMGGMVAVNSVASLLRTVVSGMAELPAAEPMQLPQNGAGLAMLYLSSCLMPAVFEELFYRGAVQGLLRPFGRRFALLAASIPFTLAHVNLWELPVVFILSVLLGYTAEICESLWPCMVLHFTNNFVVLTLEVVRQRMSGPMALAVTAWLMVLFVALVAGAIYMVRKQKTGRQLFLPKDSARLKQKKPPRMIRLLRAPVFAVGLLATAVATILRLFL